MCIPLFLDFQIYKMQIVDTHVHLYSEEFDQDRDQMMQRAIQSGISHFFVPAIDSNYTSRMYQLEKDYPENVYLMMGLHPTYVKENYQEELLHVQNQLKERKFYAIGEIGIDLYWDKTFLNQQKEVFRTQIRWAKEYDLPIVIHCREAFEEVFEVLVQENHPKLRGVFHCFTGTLEQALQAISFNMKLGIGGVLTYKNGKIDQFLGGIPLVNIVLETDAPYLSPVPFRGKRNESFYLKYIVEKMSNIYGLNSSEIALRTTENALQIFGI